MRRCGLSVGRRTSKRSLAFTTALMVFFALVVPLMGTALANHVSGLQLSPDSDTAPANTCNAFTVRLTGNQGQGVQGETVDVIVQDADQENTGTQAQESQSDFFFCTPPSTQQGQSDEFGPNPQAPRPGQNIGTQDANGNFTAGRGQTEFCCTDQNGQLTFGIQSNETGTFNVTAFFDENNDDQQAGEFSDVSSKTFTAAPATGNQGVATLDCEPESDTNPEGTTHTFVCTATDVNGNAVSGATVNFDITQGSPNDEVNNQPCQGGTSGTGNNAVTTGTTTNAQGQIVCSYTDTETADNQTTADTSPPGTDTIVVFVNQNPGPGQQGTPGPDAFEPQDTITKTFVGDANNIDCEAEDGDEAEAGDVVTIECTVTDEVGQPVPNVRVEFDEDGAGVFRGNDFCTTGADGTCEVQIETDESEAGEQIEVTATIVQVAGGTTGAGGNANDDQFRGDTNCTGSTGNAQTGTNADCTDTVTVTLTAEPGPDPDPEPQCSDGVDNDNDGFTDFPDDPDCDSVEDDSEADVGGRFATNLTIRYDGDAQPPAFKGKAGSGRRECKQGRTVLLKKVVPGPNRTVGQDTTNRRGNWRIVKRRARGRFYAVVRGETKTADGGATLVCGRDRSVTIRIRRNR